jgi:hypothetical protein
MVRLIKTQTVVPVIVGIAILYVYGKICEEVAEVVVNIFREKLAVLASDCDRVAWSRVAPAMCSTKSNGDEESKVVD